MTLFATKIFIIFDKYNKSLTVQNFEDNKIKITGKRNISVLIKTTPQIEY